MPHDALDRAEAVCDLIELLEDHGHTVHGWTVNDDGTANLDIQPTGIGGGGTK